MYRTWKPWPPNETKSFEMLDALSVVITGLFIL